MSAVQISTRISDTTKRALEQFAAAHGLKKSHLIEEALLHHLQALRDLPADLAVPPRVKLTVASFAKVSALMAKPRRPTRAMRDLMAGKPGDEP